MFWSEKQKIFFRVGLAVAVDVVLAAALVFGNYVFQYRLPHSISAIGAPVQIQAREKEAWKETFAEFFTDTVQTDEMRYSSPNAAVSVMKCVYGEGTDMVTYFVADIHIADITCFRTGFAQDTYGVGYREGMEEMSQRFGAAVAVCGDSYRAGAAELLIRNGVLYQEGVSKYDACILYYDGVMRTFSPEELEADPQALDNAYQTWMFGPALLDENGKRKKNDAFNTWDYIRENHPRTAIGYYEPGHYCMVLADGRQSDESYSRGMDLEELSLVFEDLGCKAAYNLDGGHCAMMTLNGEIVSHPYQLSKDIRDCIYIADPAIAETVQDGGEE